MFERTALSRTPCALAAVFSLLALVSVAPAAQADALDASRTEAAERFDRGIHLVDAGDLSGGLAEFLRAYSLVPAPTVLYNVGLVYAAMNRPVDSARALDKALASAKSLKPENVDRAKQVLAEQREKIGQVEVTTNVKDGTVEVDNVEVAKLPLAAALDVSGGPHVIGVISAGYAPARQEILVAGRQRVQARLDLVAIEGLLGHIEVRCRLPAADVLVDGTRVGKTPLEASVTVAPGKHSVEVRRAGYLPVTREITLQDGARGELTLNPDVDKGALDREGGWLAVKASETQSVVSADAEEIGLLTGPIHLPAGPHRIHIERGGFLPADRDISVPVGGTATVSVIFEPTPDTRANFVSSAESRRAWSWVTMAVGTAIAAGGVVLGIVEGNKVPTDQTKLDQAVADNQLVPNPLPGATQHPECNPSLGPNDMTLAACRARESNARSDLNNDKTLQTVGWVAAGVGGAVLVTGTILLLTGDNPHKYDKKPSEQLLGGWRVVPQFGPGTAGLSLGRSF
jgi:hypothetical protein